MIVLIILSVSPPEIVLYGRDNVNVANRVKLSGSRRMLNAESCEHIGTTRFFLDTGVPGGGGRVIRAGGCDSVEGRQISLAPRPYFSTPDP